jgi:prepilin-type N-terminal cleavage/methylation domain-containing protein
MTRPHYADSEPVRKVSARLIRRTHRREDGFTLVELLVTMLVLGLVLGATISLLTTAYAIVPGDIEWTHMVEDTQTGMNRMTRELRQGNPISRAADGSWMSADVAGVDSSGNAISKHVLWQCTTVCTRWETIAPATAPSTSNFASNTNGQTFITNVQNTALGVPVFGNPSTNYYTVDLRIKSGGSVKSNRLHSVTFKDGFFGRNV